ncbi:MAG TPA: cytochrome d ubiquinol oxidase subunit II, partial [Anaeromyxobacteraceae bacterium]|nr:cytochrome d ubiquinol oxidase subunit II [Anaeromyxobacteraceae bacterium]
NPLFLILTALLVAAIVAVPVLSRRGRAGAAFLASATAIVAMVFVSALTMFPRLVPSSIDLANSLTVYNAASSKTTLTVMLVIALVGMPLVLLYTAFVYRVFKGKVVGGGEGYAGAVRPAR